MFKYRLRMFLNELKVLVLMRTGSSSGSVSGSRRREPVSDPLSVSRAPGLGSCGWPCGDEDDENDDEEDEDDDEEYYGAQKDVMSLADSTSSHSPQCRICFQGTEQGELLSPCRCDGSVRCTHQPCLIRWISERGSWSCELCYFKYQVLAISTKNPLQWQTISLTVIEKVQIAAVILGSLFLVASVSWLVWSSLSPSAKWQRQDLLFQICYGMYGFMDIVCIGLIIHEGSSVYRIFKRWQAVNQQWKVLNYEKAKDSGDTLGPGAKAGPRRARSLPHLSGLNPGRTGRRIRTLLNQHCGYTILHIINHLRSSDHRLGTPTNREVVMRVTTV